MSLTELKGKTVKVYQNVRTKFGYEGDARIEEVIRKVSDNLYQVNLAFEDSYFTGTIDSRDILY